MIEMSVDSLDRVERLCRELPNYRVCIYCEGPHRALTVYDALLNTWGGVQGDRYFGGGLAIRFTATNSIVRIMEPQDLRVTTLYSCHEVVKDIGFRVGEEVERRLDSLIVTYELGPRFHTTGGGLIRSNNIIIDEFSHDGWLCDDNRYTIYFENGSSITPIRNAPDLGEIEPSAELLEYIRGEYGTTDRTEFKACN